MSRDLPLHGPLNTSIPATATSRAYPRLPTMKVTPYSTQLQLRAVLIADETTRIPYLTEITENIVFSRNISLSALLQYFTF
jgi:hypothetical protein